MSRIFTIMAVWMLPFIGFVATPQISADPPPAPPSPQANPPVAAPDETIQNKVLPALDLQAVPLSEFLDFVHTLQPSFQFVIVRDPTVPADYPILPEMKLKKVTFGQILAIIQEAVPGMEVHPVEAEGGAITYVFKISGAMAGDLSHAPQTSLKVYRLTEAVTALAAPHLPGSPLGLPNPNDAAVVSARKNALDAVLSLVKASVAQAGDNSVNPVIQVHEETLTLIVRGTADQIGAVQMALDALTPEGVLAPMKEKFAETERRYDSQLARAADESARRAAELEAARAEIEKLHQSMLQLEVAQERLKVQLEAAKNKPAPKE